MNLSGCARAGRRTLAAAAAAAAIAGCGGGDQVGQFTPTRVLAFGDESSVITAEGRKYTVNALKSDNTTLDCATHALWIQTIANAWAIVFPQCNPNAVASPSGKIYAAAGAKAGDLAAQVKAHRDSGSFGRRDLATVLVGANDIVELYNMYPATGADALVALAETRGAMVAAQVNEIAIAGAKVVVATTLDIGQSPFGIAEGAKGADRPALLSRLASRFNARLRTNLINDGRIIALTLADERVQSIVARPGDWGFANVRDATCLPSAPLPSCTTQTLAAGASIATWLWADALRLSPGGHSKLGELAVSNINNNPFAD